MSNEATRLPKSRIRRDQGPEHPEGRPPGTRGDASRLQGWETHLGRNRSADTLISGFQPPELEGAKFLLFQLPSQGLCHSSSS